MVPVHPAAHGQPKSSEKSCAALPMQATTPHREVDPKLLAGILPNHKAEQCNCWRLAGQIVDCVQSSVAVLYS